MNPEYVEYFIRFLEEIWLRHLSEEMKRELPRRIFLTEYIRTYNPHAVSQMSPLWPFQFASISTGRANGWAMALAYTSQLIVNLPSPGAGLPPQQVVSPRGIHEMTGAQKTEKAQTVTSALFMGLLRARTPESWFEFSDYVNAPIEFNGNFVAPGQSLMGIQDNPNGVNWNPNHPNLHRLIAFREQGFLPNSFQPNGMPNMWLTNLLQWTNARDNDIDSFLHHMLRSTDEQMAFFLETYPLINTKWHYLLDYFNRELGIDVRGIANTVFTD
jgi:hypothetical protein